MEFLDPKRLLVDAVADYLAARVHVECGVPSLAGCVVVVPTAESGRSLRLALARRFPATGLLPPRIALASVLLEEAVAQLLPDAVIATSAEELAVLAGVILAHEPKRSLGGALDHAAQILELYRILGEKGMLLGDVVSPEEPDRWQRLAALEKDYLAALHAHGRLSRAESRHLIGAPPPLSPSAPPPLSPSAPPPLSPSAPPPTAVGATPAPPSFILPAAIDLPDVFLAYLTRIGAEVTVLVHADPAEAARFDAWGRPLPSPASRTSHPAPLPPHLAPSLVSAAPSAELEAAAVARYFREVRPDEALPALVACDAEMLPDLEGAFQNRFGSDELVLRNPANEKLATSALGRLLTAILELKAHGDYAVLSTFVRTGDVARWAAAAFAVTPETVAGWIGALDAVQNAHLPRTLAETIRAAEAEHAEGLLHLLERIRDELADPYRFLRRIFATLTLDTRSPADRELIAAAESVQQVREDCASAVIPPSLRDELELRLLKEARFSLEPAAPNVLALRGWLEVPWCAEPELVIAGFNEGCVPESVVGHPFLPDSLRARLGLLTNARREARDAFILAEALRSRAPGAVRIHLHQLAGDHNVMKPSRLLFPCVTDAELPDFARRLYAVTRGSDTAPARSIPAAWHLNLPVPPRGEVYRTSLAVTLLDAYLASPFDFYLAELFGEHPNDRFRELDPRAFGTLCHAALEKFAETGPKESEDPDEIAAFLADEVHASLAAFGVPLPAVLELQGEAAVARLTAFASIQAAWHRAGWRIIQSERAMACRLKDVPTYLKGRLDRMDRNVRTGQLAIIDYKTWAAPRPDVSSLQLPLYRAMVQASGRYDPDAAAGSIALYCILGERPENTCFDLAHAATRDTQDEAEQCAVELLRSLAKGVYWPPGPGSRARENYGGLLGDDPEAALDPDWLADQKARLA